MLKKIKIIQIIRFIVQIVFFVLFSGLFVLAFSGIKETYLMILSGKFSFKEILPYAIEALTIIPLTIILGRFFCGWFCAFGALNDFIFMITKRVFKIRFQVNETLDSILKYLKYFVLIFIVDFMWTLGTSMFDSFSPWDAFAQATDFSQAFPDYVAGFVIFGFIILGAAVIERFFCRYLCPLGAIFTLSSRLRIINVLKPTAGCGKCKLCTKSCPMGITLYKTEKVTNGECINCFKCVEVCPRKNAQAGIFNEALNPSLAGTLAITAFTAVYSVSNMAASANSPQITIAGTGYNNTQTDKGSLADKSYSNDGSNVKDSVKTSKNKSKKTKTSVKASKNKATQSNSDKSLNTQKASNNKTQNDNSSSVRKTGKTTSGTSPKPTPKITPKSTPKPTPKPTIKPIPKSNNKYKDGTFIGVGRGFRPGLEVAVTIKNDRITSVEILSNNETPRYAYMPMQIVPSEIIQAQSTNVDSVSGATRTSNGIKMAVSDALGKALVQA